MLFNEEATLSSKQAGPFLVTQDRQDVITQGQNISWLCQQTIDTVVNDLWNASGIHGNDRQSACGGFEQDQALGFDFRGGDEEAGVAVNLSQKFFIGDRAGEMDALRDTYRVA